MTRILFSTGPYVAFGLLVIGLLVRFLITSQRIDELRAEAAESWATFGGSRVWRITMVVLALAHLGGLALPRTVLLWNGAPMRLLVLEATGFLVGAVAIVGWAGVMRRHLRQPGVSVRSELADCLLLSLLAVGLVSGVLMAGIYRWGSSWGAATLAPYLVSVLRGAPLTPLIEQMPHLVQLHVLTTLGIMIVLPFTRASSNLVLAAHRLVGVAGRPLSAATQATDGWLARFDPSSWLWPEEECLAIGGGAEQGAAEEANAMESARRPTVGSAPPDPEAPGILRLVIDPASHLEEGWKPESISLDINARSRDGAAMDKSGTEAG